MLKQILGKAEPLGVTIEGNRVNFAVSVPLGKSCELLLFKKAGTEIAYRYSMQKALGEVRFLALEGEQIADYEYLYLIDKKLCLDPYVKEITGHRIFGQKELKSSLLVRGKIGTGIFDWEEDEPLHIPWHEVVAYSLHIRGFTMHSSSGVKHRGTFAGAVEKLSYLKELGINQIQCMPIYEFEEWANLKPNYWGYGRGFYFAPKAAYAASEEVSLELKNMVKQFHRVGIEVVLEMPFAEGILPQTALDCLRYYMTEYHVDGFLVNPWRVPWDMLMGDPYLKGVKLLRKEDKFQNTMRRFLKGDEGMVGEVISALRHNAAEDGCCNYITGHTGFTLCDLVSYDGKHNEANGERNQDGPVYNYSWNCGAEGPSRRKTVTELRERQMRNAFFLLLFAQGTPCILAGDEFANTQNGNNNVYCQDNETGWLNWSRLRHRKGFWGYVRDLIVLRKSHPILHQKEMLSGADRTASGLPDVSYHGESAWQAQTEVASRQLGVLYGGVREKDTECFVAYNMHWIAHGFALPTLRHKKKWYLAAETMEGVLETPKLLEDQRMAELEARSAALFVAVHPEETANGTPSSILSHYAKCE